MRAFILASLAGFFAGSLVVAEPSGAREANGTARLFSNDALGDGEDRWHTGSYFASHYRGPAWQGSHAARPGERLEFRFNTSMIAPQNLENPETGDRRYAGVLSFGVHTPFVVDNTVVTLGGDLVITGPQTGIADVQDAFHDAFGNSDADFSNQIENGVYPTVSVDVAQGFSFGQTVVRPYATAQAGYETWARVGADVVLGPVGQGALTARDPVTGTLVRADRIGAQGLSFIAGADFAAVVDSVLLPSSDGYILKDRFRARAGVHWAKKRTQLYYGLTWMSEEFEQQDESQVVGSVSINFAF